jgi:hypothetical protein
MRSPGWIGLLAIAMGAAFGAGLAAGRAKKPEQPPARELTKVEAEKPKARDDSVLSASLERFRGALAEKEGEAERLRNELVAIRTKLAGEQSSEDDQSRKELEEKLRRQKRHRALEEKSKPLRDKILQRGDGTLRAESLDELVALLAGDDREGLLVGLEVLHYLGCIRCDKERFKPYAVNALNHDDSDVRESALHCLGALFSSEDRVGLLLQMASDPSAEVRRVVADSFLNVLPAGKNEEALSAMRSLLNDTDAAVRRKALDALWWRADNPAQLEDVAVELARTATALEERQEMANWLSRRMSDSPKIARCFTEMYEEYGKEACPLYLLDIRADCLAEEVKPIVNRFCLRLVTQSVDPEAREQALTILGRMEHAPVLAELEEIARSEDAEGIDEQLAETIERLRQKGGEQR